MKKIIPFLVILKYWLRGKSNGVYYFYLLYDFAFEF